MSAQRELFNNTLRVGLEENTYPGCSNSLNELLNCGDIFARSIGYWLQLVWNGPIEFIIYPEASEGGWNLTLFNDLYFGKIDVNPVETVILEEYVQNFTILSTLSFDYYKFYTKQPCDAENGIKFLFSPFKTKLWITITIFICFISCMVHWFKNSNLCKNFPHYNPILNSFSLYNVFRAFICCIYSSHLCALLTIQTNDIPIKNIEHLVHKIYEQQTVIYLEGTNIWRWLLLMDGEFERPQKLNILQKALNETGSLKIERNITALCQHVSTNENAVYFSYDDLVLVECPQFCFWTYEITEIPIVPAAFLMSKHSKFLRNGLISAHSVLNYRRNTMRMMKSVAHCKSQVQEKGDLIGQRSLFAALLLYACSVITGIIVLLIEIFSRKYQKFVCCKQNTYSFHKK